MTRAQVQIVELEGDDAQVREMLVELALHEQVHYDHPHETREQLAGRLTAEPRFVGENHVLVARGPDGAAAGLCWVVMFDPGTGLEAEVAELYVRPEKRGGGIAAQLLESAVQLMRRRQVTFASVWTRGDNAGAMAAYRAAGFKPTQQTVLTWLPLNEPGE